MIQCREHRMSDVPTYRPFGSGHVARRGRRRTREEPVTQHGWRTSGPPPHAGPADGAQRQRARPVARFEPQMLVATDAASEGLNLQTLGTMINVDLPWNPSRLEQRLGRIKRFGQRRHSVDMLNLVYQGTQDEKVYEVLSQRMKDRYDIFGSLPDTIDDEWIEDMENLEETMDKYMHLRKKARDAFEIRYEHQVDPDAERWELCSRVLARRDIVEKLSSPW